MRLGIEQDVPDVHRADAVDECVMGLGREDPGTVGESVKQHHLPQRAGPVKAMCPEVGEPIVQLGVAAWRRKRRVAHVGAHVERRVLDPQRAAQPVRARI